MINIESLCENDIRLAVGLISKKELFNFIKINRKNFSETIKGTRLTPQSSLLQKRIPEAIFEKIKRKDKVTLKFAYDILNKKLRCINKLVESDLEFNKDMHCIIDNTDININSSSKIVLYISLIMKTNEKRYYINLIDILLKRLNLNEIYIFFVLNGIDLSISQKKLMDESIQEVKNIKIIEEKLKNKEKEILKKEIENIKIDFNNKLKIEKSKNKELNDRFNKIETSMSEEKNLLNKKILEYEEKNNILNKKLKKLDEKNKSTNGYLKILKNEFKLNLEKEIKIKKELQEKNDKLNNELGKRYEIYSKDYKLKWEEDNKKILKEEIILKEKVNKLNDYIIELQSNIANLEILKEEKKKKLDNYNNIIKSFIDNIDREIIIESLRSSMLNINTNTKLKENNVYIKESIKINESKVEVCEDICDFSDCIAHNLKSIGVGKIRNELSDYIVSVLSSKLIPLIIGYKSREVAKAISYAYSGETPFIVTLPLGYDNINKLMEIYNNCESKVILIEGVVGQMNESIITSLFREYVEYDDSNKIILFTCEDNDMIDLMPRYLFEYITLIRIFDIKPVMKYKYDYLNSVDVLKSFRTRNLNIGNSYKKLNKLFKNLNLNKSYIISRALILAYLYEVREENRALECLILCDINLNLTNTELIEKIIKNIKDYIEDFNLELLEVIKGE